MFVEFDMLNTNIIKTGLTKLRSVLQRRTLSVTRNCFLRSSEIHATKLQ